MGTASGFSSSSHGRAITVIVAVVTLFLVLPSGAGSASGRFFLMGDGIIHIRNAKTGEEVRASLVSPDGSLDEKGLTAVDRVFGFPTEEKGDHISPRLLFMLDYFSDLVAPGKVINLESGYRSPRYNEDLRNSGANAARTSTHIDGMALDFNIDDVNGKELWETIRSLDCCGAGHYGGANVHLDSAKPRFWEAATSKTKTRESDYNRKIYLSTDFDRYRRGDSVRLLFSSVSDFGFGIGRTVAIVSDTDGDDTAASSEIIETGGAECIIINDRKASRFIHFTVPPDLGGGRYRVRLDFCSRPFEQMPRRAVSNEIELY